MPRKLSKERLIQKLNFKMTRLANNRLAAPLALFLLSTLCYGLYLSWMGFYWDDWPISWLSYVSDSESIKWFQFQRPLSGWVLYIGSKLLGQVPLYWQIFTFFLRFISSIAVWWLVKAIWPEKTNGAFVIAALFLVFPGFSQQFVSVNSAPHLVAMILFICSLALMVVAERKSSAKQIREKWIITGLSIGSGLLAMLTTDYFYGLELLRPLILWFAADEKRRSPRYLVKTWPPYLLLLVSGIIWRSYMSQFGAYPLSLLDHFREAPVQTVVTLGQTIIRDLVTATWGTWVRIFTTTPAKFGVSVSLYFWFLIILVAGATFALLMLRTREKTGNKWAWHCILLGLLALLTGGISFWVPGLALKFTFPSDRLMLPMMLGSVLVVVGLVKLVILGAWGRALIFSTLIGLAVGSQFLSALGYRVDWDNQVRFVNQLAWRVPGLRSGTTLISEELPFTYETDNSFTAAINWIYAPAMVVDPDYYDWEYKIESFAALPYMLRYLDLRLGWQLPYLEESAEYVAPFRFFQFRGSSAQVLLLYFEQGACLRVFDPIYDEGHPDLLNSAYYKGRPDLEAPSNFHELTAYALPYSDPNLILSDPGHSPQLPEEILGPEIAHDWCYYFEKAELARQNGDWSQVVKLGDKAFSEFGIPDAVSELPVFIEAYAITGNLEKAIDLANEAIKVEPRMDIILCKTWGRVANAIGEGNRVLIAEQLNALNCE